MGKDNKKKVEPKKSSTVDEIIEEVCNEEVVVEEGIVEESEDLEKKLIEAVENSRRIAAEYYNYRERTTKEKASMYDDGVRGTIDRLLPVVDNFERAVSVQKDKESADDSFFKGIEMILKQLKEILVAIGVEEIPAVGEKFDPNLHSAVSHIDDESYGEGEVTVEMMKGYKFKEKVIRHSMVQVAN